MEVHERLLRSVPGYMEARAKSENFALRAMAGPFAGRTGCTSVPVVVHVVYETAAQNIGDAQIQRQIDVLNDDLRMENADLTSVPRRVPDGRVLDLDDVGAVWCRRIRPLTLHDDLTDATARLFAWSEANEALLGLWYSLDCPWMNAPAADESSQRKLRPLQVARSLGIAIPETVITNDPATARAFLEELGPDNVVRKAFRNLAQAPRETSIVHDAGLALVDSVRYTPVIFQRFVPAALDLRVTIVEDEISTAAVRSGPAYRPTAGSAWQARRSSPTTSRTTWPRDSRA